MAIQDIQGGTKRIIEVTCDGKGRLRRVPLEKLQRFQGALKSLGEDQYRKLKDSIAKHGFFVPVFVWRNKILDGHQRLLVIEKEKWAVRDGVPVVDIEAETESDAAEKLLLISSTYGKIEPQGLYDFTELHDIPLTVSDLPDLPDFDLEGFKNAFYEEEEEDEGAADDVPDAPEVPISKTGDLWLLGGHRLLCGDSTSGEDVARLMPHDVPLCLTDPPYNVGRDYDVSTDDTKADYEGWSVRWFTIAQTKCDRVAFSCGHSNVVMWASIEAWHWMLCWYKGNAMLGSPFGFCNWEPVLFYGKPHRPKGHDVIVQPIVVQKDLEAHDCPKQLGFGLKLLELLSEVGDDVYDPFLGSGTTLIAAEQLNRRCYGMEISPSYCDVIVKRWEIFTGQEATLEGDGRTFGEVAEERGVASVAA